MNSLADIVLGPLALDLLLAGGALVVFFADLLAPSEEGKGLGYVTAAVLLGVLVASFFLETDGVAVGGAYVGGPWPLFLKRLFLSAGLLTTLGSMEYLETHQPRRQGEYYLLLLFSLLGMTLLAGAQDLLLLIVCFELMGIPLYMLATWAKTDDKTGRDRNGPEAGLKLYLVGAVSTAITLYGLSIVVGLAGTTAIGAIGQTAPSPLLRLGMFFVLGGMGFKIGVAPFHMWVPDTYQGAPTPFVAFLSVAPKIAGFTALAALFMRADAFGGDGVDVWLTVVLALAVLTLFVGHLMALAQSNIKRLLAYSGVAQIGYMLMAFATGAELGLATLLFYFAAYLATNIGAFLVVQAVTASTEGDDDVDDFTGLYRRSPWAAMAMMLFLLSLAGIPFVAGFWAKLYVFMAAYQAGLGWLVFLGAVLAVVGLFYYLQVIRAMYMRPPVQEAPVKVQPIIGVAIVLCLFVVLAMGLYPDVVLDDALAASAQFFGSDPS